MKAKPFDANLVVIGAGAAGLVTSYIAATVNAKVILIEKEKMGGDCLNTGCVPSKALIRAAKAAHEVRQAHQFGVQAELTGVDFAKAMQHVHTAIKNIEPHDSVERYEKLGVECLKGHANLISKHEVEVNGRIIRTRNIVIATGGKPYIPNVDGLDQVPFYTSDTLWQMKTQPKHLAIVGAGAIGCELAQAFQRLGTQVTLIQQAQRILPREDEDVSALMQRTLTEEGVNILTQHKWTRCSSKDGSPSLELTTSDGKSVALPCDALLVAAGRSPNTGTLDLASLGIETDAKGFIKVNEKLQTSVPNIYACGDCIGPYLFTHVAAHQAWYASVNSLFKGFKQFKVNYSVIPWATFTSPEVARVGLNEQEATAKGLPYELTTYHLDDLDRAIADTATKGFIKVLTKPNSDKILGATLVGEHAGELVTEFITAMKQGTGLNQILGTIHIYPTYSEANKYAAGEWKRNHAPQWILRLLKWFFRFRLG